MKVYPLRPALIFLKRSANMKMVPLGHCTSKYDAHLPSANSGKIAESAGSPYEKDPPRKLSRHFFFCPSSTISAEILSSLSEIEIIETGVPATMPSGLCIESCTCDLSSRHFAKIKNASADEMFVMQLALSFGPKEATALATKWNLKLRPPLRELLAGMNGHGKSYTKQSAKTRQPSGSPASSRKHL